MKVFSRELKVCYDLDGELIELSQDTGDEGTFKFSILDADKVNGYTTFEFNNIEELEDAIKDFKETLNKIK